MDTDGDGVPDANDDDDDGDGIPDNLDFDDNDNGNSEVFEIVLPTIQNKEKTQNAVERESYRSEVLSRMELKFSKFSKNIFQENCC